MELKIGSHVSFNKDTQLVGSLKEAISYGSNTFMFYTGAPQNTNRVSLNPDLIKKAYDMMIEYGIKSEDLIVHAPYIVNLANPVNFDFGVSFLKQEVERCSILGIENLVLHPGSHVNNGVNVGLNTIVDALKIVLNEDKGVNICLETMAGKGTELGRNFDELKYIIDSVNSNNLKVCMDTCHLNDAGYDLNDFDKILDEFDEKIGINKLACIHINDSKNEINSHKDRHENIGFGTIGFNTLINIIYNERIKDIPKILETPYVKDEKFSYPPYKFEIEMIKNRCFNENMIDDIKKIH